MRENILKLKDYVLFIFDFAGLDRQKVTAKAIDEEELLKEGVYIASGSQIFETCEGMTDLLDGLNCPVLSISPWTANFQCLIDHWSQMMATHATIKLLKKWKSKTS